jgi:hypothetical protein
MPTIERAKGGFVAIRRYCLYVSAIRFRAVEGEDVRV